MVFEHYPHLSAVSVSLKMLKNILSKQEINFALL